MIEDEIEEEIQKLNKEIICLYFVVGSLFICLGISILALIFVLVE